MRFSLGMLAVLLGVVFFLHGCTKAPPEIRYHNVYCMTPEQYKRVVEAMPPKIGDKLTGDAQKDFKLSAEQNVKVRVYADGLLTILGGCTGSAPPNDG